MRNLAYFILFVEGIADAITTYVCLRLGFPEVNIVLKYVWYLFGNEILTGVLIWWAFYRIRLIQNMYKAGANVSASFFLIGAVAVSGYVVMNNLAIIYLCLQFSRCTH